MENLTPTLDNERLQQAVNDAAMKGAMKAIDEFYTSYNSPFVKAISEQLELKGIKGIIELPDIVALINQKAEEAIMEIANTAIVNTYLPKIKKAITKAEPKINFSEILKAFADEEKESSFDDFSCDVDEDDRFGWLDIKLKGEDTETRFTLHKNRESKTYHLLSLPNTGNVGQIKINIGDAKVEMPMIRTNLDNYFDCYLASLVIAKSEITMDQDYFSEDMFEDRCRC